MVSYLLSSWLQWSKCRKYYKFSRFWKWLFEMSCNLTRQIFKMRFVPAQSVSLQKVKLDTTEEKEKQHSICGCDCYCCTVLAVENSAPTVFKMQWAESSFGSSHTWLRQSQLNCDQGGLALKWKKRRRFDSMNSSNNYFQNQTVWQYFYVTVDINRRQCAVLLLISNLYFFLFLNSFIVMVYSNLV